MAKILGEDYQLYYPVPQNTFTERSIQEMIATKSNHIFPGFTFILCDPLIESDYDARKPDFILVENEYKSWWIGEVEKSDHSIDSHVLPQIQAFLDGYYDERHVKRIWEGAAHLDRTRLESLIFNESPSVLVVVDRMIPEWKQKVESKGAKLALFEIFRSKSNRFLFRINGFCPTPPSVFQSNCRILASMRQLLLVESPSGFNWQSKQTVSVLYRDMFIDWTVIISDGTTWLRTSVEHNLDVNCVYKLILHQNGEHELEEKSR